MPGRTIGPSGGLRTMGGRGGRLPPGTGGAKSGLEWAMKSQGYRGRERTTSGRPWEAGWVAVALRGASISSSGSVLAARWQRCGAWSGNKASRRGEGHGDPGEATEALRSSLHGHVRFLGGLVERQICGGPQGAAFPRERHQREKAGASDPGRCP